MFARIERLKSEWTDRYVVVDAAVPELARFAAATGQVKTVNMNGRCLVEFDQFNNVGWYDIDPSCLKVVPKPVPKPAEAKAAKPAAKPVAPKPAAEKAAATPAAKPAAKPAGARPSTADILAAARAKASTTATAADASATPKPPAAKAPPAGTASPSATGKLSTAEILARARAAKGGGESAAVPAPTSAPPEGSGDAEDAGHATVGQSAEPPAAVTKPAKPASGKGPLPTTTADKIAWCRANDAK